MELTPRRENPERSPTTTVKNLLDSKCLQHQRSPIAFELKGSSRTPVDHASFTFLRRRAAYVTDVQGRSANRLSDAGDRWIVDTSSLDGYPLDSAYEDIGAHNSECPCGQPEECERVRAAADQIPLPTGRELAALIAQAL
jgi:hypothetical protein